MQTGTRQFKAQVLNHSISFFRGQFSAVSLWTHSLPYYPSDITQRWTFEGEKTTRAAQSCD